VKQSRSIPWVSWSVVCKPKREGGLGVRDLRQVNLALLAKWRWRYLVGDGGIWNNIISARYGGCLPSPHLGGRPSGLRGASSWWSNISLLGGDKEAAVDWFSEGCLRLLGTVFRPNSGMILVVGRFSLELGLVAYFGCRSRVMGW